MPDVHSLTLLRAQPERSLALGAHLLDLATLAVTDAGAWTTGYSRAVKTAISG